MAIFCNMQKKVKVFYRKNYRTAYCEGKLLIMCELQ